MEDKFVKVDLHIHTPASNCYEGPSDDDEYLKILRRCKEKDLKVIAITDHNTIEGYRKLCRIKEKLSEERESLISITDSTQARSRVKANSVKLELFRDILILPGIELEVSNGIHLLVIFNNTFEIEKIESLLINAGYIGDQCGKESPDIVSNWDIFHLFDESKKYDCFVIDAHTDSDKGILNTIPKGHIRAACFKSEQLVAVAYKNEKQKDMLQNTIANSIEYRRGKPLSFVKFSDSHKASDIGAHFTYIKLENINFDTLKSAFAEPSELVSIERPSLLKILNRLIHKENSFYILDFSDENMKKFHKLICALNNSTGGHILVGVSEEKNKIGVKISGPSDESEIMKIISLSLRNLQGVLAFNINFYELHDCRVIISFSIGKNENIINIRGDAAIYSITNGKLVVLSARDIQRKIEDNCVEQLQNRLLKKIISIERECKIVRNYFASLPIIRKYEENSMQNAIEVEICERIQIKEKVDDKIRKDRRDYSEGKSRGNIYYFDSAVSPRLKYAYLRYSAPTFSAKNIRSKASSKDILYVIPGGAVFYSKKLFPYVSPTFRSIYILSVVNNELVSNKFIACFLKSSFFIWYCIRKYDETNIFIRNILDGIRIPLFSKEQGNKELIKKTEIILDNILKKEKSFLTSFYKLEKEERSDLIINHNNNIEKLAYTIDRNIYDLFKLSSEEIDTIEADLRMHEIYLPKNTIKRVSEADITKQ